MILIPVLFGAAKALVPEPVSDIFVHALAGALPDKEHSGTGRDLMDKKKSAGGTGNPTSAKFAAAKQAGLTMLASLRSGKPNKDLIRAFQQAAGNLKVDGVYGPKTAGALMYYTGESELPDHGNRIEVYTPGS